MIHLREFCYVIDFIFLLFFYTIVHGIMMFLAGVPFFFYKLTGKTKEDVHNKVLELRAKTESKQK